jgi:hypothetical protein
MHDGTEQLRTEIVMGVSTSATLQDAVSATGNGTDFTVDGYGITTLQITGTFVATITFYGSADGTNFVNISATNRNTGARVLNTTSTGLYDIDCRGLQKIRASVTWTSGTSVTVFGVAEPFSGSNSTLEISNSNVEQTPGSAIPAKAVVIAGKDSGDFTQTPFVGNSGDSDAWGATNGMLTTTFSMLYNGDTWDRQRISSRTGGVSANVANNTTVDVWTPATGKKFRIMAYLISVSVAGKWEMWDGATGIFQTILLEANKITPIEYFGNGHISSTANNALVFKNLTGSTSDIHITTFGTEE